MLKRALGILVLMGIGSHLPAMAGGTEDLRALSDAELRERGKMDSKYFIACGGDMVAVALLVVPQAIPGVSLVEPAVAAMVDSEFTIFPKKEAGESKGSHFGRSAGNLLIVAGGGMGATLGDTIRNLFTGGRHQDLLGKGSATHSPAIELVAEPAYSLANKVTDQECKDASKRVQDALREIRERTARANQEIAELTAHAVIQNRSKPETSIVSSPAPGERQRGFWRAW